MRYISVCSGIESATVAWAPLGWRAHWFAEIEAFPAAILAHHYPEIANRGDITTFAEWPDADVDVLVGGTPCQSFSVAGRRAGLDDSRGNLMLTYLEIAERYRPRWLVWENVPGVLSVDGGRAFGALLGGLAILGYGWAYRILDAQYFELAQRRARVFVVASLGGWQRAAAVLFERASLQGDPAPSRTARQTAPTLPSRGSGGGGGLIEESSVGALQAGAKGPGSATTQGAAAGHLLVYRGDTVSHALTTRPGGKMDHHGETYIAHTLRGEGFDASEDGTGRGTPIVPICFDETQITSKENRCNPQRGNPSHPLAAEGRPPTIAFDARQDPSIYGDAAGALSAGLPQSQAVYTLAVRRLTPRECERLQGFPDDYTLIPYRGKPAADGPRYRALGNSKAVPVVRWIGSRIQAVDQLAQDIAA